MWKFVLGAGILALLIGCGGSGGSSTTGGGTGQITRAYDGSWHGTFQTIDHYDSGNITFEIVDGHLTGLVNRRDPNGGPRVDEEITATTYDNPIVVGDVNHTVFSSAVQGPNMRFQIRIGYPTYGGIYANVIASH